MRLISCLLLLLTFSDVREAEKIFEVGRQLYAEGKYKQAADTLKISVTLFEQAGKTIQQVKAANLQAESLSNLGQCDAAVQLLQHSLNIIGNQDNAVLAETYYYLSRHAGGCARKFDDAIGLMQKSLDIKKEIYKPGDPSFAFDYTFLGYIYNSKGKYDSALIFLNQAIAIREKDPNSDKVETSHTLFNLAASYEGKSQLGKALDLNLQALQTRTEKLGSSHVTVANSINSIGRIYRKLGNNERALEYYRQALDIRKNTLGANHPNVAGSYYEIGNLYGNISNYHASLEFIQEGNRILESNSQVANDVLPTYIAYAGKMYGLTGRHDNAKAAIQKAIAMAENKLNATHPYRAVVYNIAGEYYSETGELDKQAEYFNKALVVYRTSYGNGSEREADVISKMAATYAKYGQPDKGLSMYKEALALYTARIGSQNPKAASVYLAIGDIHALNENLGEAESDYQQALLSTDSTNKPMMLKIIRSKAKIQNGEAALASYDEGLALTDEIAQGYNNEAARIQLEREKRQMCADAMNIAWQLYSKTQNRGVLEDAFLIAERSKAALLLENTKDLRAKTMAGVPDSLVEKERDLRIEVAYDKTNLYQAQKNKDTSAATAFEKNVFDSERKLEAFKSRLERSFPAYFRLKYNNTVVALADVQKRLPENTMVLQYFVGENDIYRFAISQSSADLKKTPRDEVLKNTVANYQKSLTDFSFIMNNQREADSLYQATARTLHTLLMIGNESPKLVIIPDDFLAQLNFGTLLHEDIKERNYATLPYLNNKHIISYAYSSALLGETNKRSVSNFAGFAPSYDQIDYTDVDSTMHPMAALVVRSGNLPLPGATEEVNAISKLMRGESWINEEATETNFKKHSGDYDVLHLAMHSLLNDEEPRYSELLFNHRKDNENDGYLTIAEIYNLKLNAQLVVLSACSSGFGKIQHGEGPISLSRAFSYAGCPSVVMSLWKVPDLVTTSIMKNFYESLSDGLSKDEALRAAQVKFLKENSDPIYGHPYYWAGFVVIGDTSPIEKNSYWGYFLLGIGVVVVAGVLVRRFRNT